MFFLKSGALGTALFLKNQLYFPAITTDTLLVWLSILVYNGIRMKKRKKIKFGIFGSSSADHASSSKIAGDIGRLFAERGDEVVTGGVTGYPHLVALGARQYGGKAIAYVAGCTIKDHHRFYKTDLSAYSKIVFQKNYAQKRLSVLDLYLRSLRMVADIDKAVIIGGRVGTLFEMTMTCAMNKHVFVLRSSGGITGRTIKAFEKEAHKSSSAITYFSSAEELSRALSH